MHALSADARRGGCHPRPCRNAVGTRTPTVTESRRSMLRTRTPSSPVAYADAGLMMTGGCTPDRKSFSPTSRIRLGALSDLPLQGCSVWVNDDLDHCLARAAGVYALVYALGVPLPEVLSSREFRAGLAAVLEQVRRSPHAAV